jgi:transposase
LPPPLGRIGLEAGPLSQWLQAALIKAGFDAVLLETRHVKAALSAMIVKTDRWDARGIAQLLRMGWFRPVHCKSAPAQEVRVLLVARKQLQAKMRDVELSLRGLLRSFGLKVGEISKGQFATRVRVLVAGHTMLERVADAMLQAREALRTEFAKLHRAMLAIVREDAVCRRLMTVPGVGALIAVTFTSGVDDPRAVRPIQRGGSALWPDAPQVPNGRDGRHGRRQPGGRRDSSHGPVRGGAHLAHAGGTVLGAEALGVGGGAAARHEAGEGGARPQAGGDLLDNVAKFSIGIVHTIAREALRRSPRADPVLKDSSRSGRARPVQDGVHHGQAMQGTPTPQP